MTKTTPVAKNSEFCCKSQDRAAGKNQQPCLQSIAERQDTGYKDRQAEECSL